MVHRTLPQSGLARAPRRVLFAAAAVLALAGLFGLSLCRRSPTRNGVEELATGSPYANTRLGVKYVGDAACIECHAEIVETYRRHPMGRSLAPIARAASLAANPGSELVQFDVNGLIYSVRHEGDLVIHQETRRNASGRVIAKVEADVAYVIGSGRQAFSYLFERDGFLFESPITWYAKDKRWGLSPGYDVRKARFERPILSECLFCHANRAERVSEAINRYRTPIFQGHAIGCERCHGPGELHVGSPKVIDGQNLTIVNPANLEPSLRDAVCEQCHLIGPRRVSRLGTNSEDFRPGLPFQRFWSVFVPASSENENKFASHAEQMHASRCYQATSGRLGCISCHDPHVLPSPAETESFFRSRCLKCHDVRPCSLAADVRVKRAGTDNCVGCHMPRLDSSNNTHVATTNHRVPRRAHKGPETPIAAESTSNGRSDLVHFHRDLLSDAELALTERDRGIALCRSGGTGAAAAALPLLQAAVAAHPGDLRALESLGEVLGRLGRPAEGFSACMKAVSLAPHRQTALEGAAYLAFKAGRHQEAVDLWKRAIAVNPHRSDYHAELAAAALQLRDWPAAALACRAALRLNPMLVTVRAWLVQSELHLGDHEAARQDFEHLLAFDPANRDELVRRFSSLVSPR
jgi:tetratricopeptide (TPR) repeat protein